MRILLTNDDGILAPGIKALYRAVRDLGDIDVVAPASQQTAVGHGISVATPLTVERLLVRDAFQGWSVTGRPADCVKLGILRLLDHRPDFVISGINAGMNTGMYTLYSGTVAAAAEAALFFGIPSLAISLEEAPEPAWDLAGRIARRVFEQFLAARPAPGLCLNVNIPTPTDGRPHGIRVCRRTTVTATPDYRMETDPLGRAVYYFHPGDPQETCDPGTDSEAVLNGYVSVTPLSFDVTATSLLEAVSKWPWPTRFD
jgi:5'-nucleotidase